MEFDIYSLVKDVFNLKRLLVIRAYRFRQNEYQYQCFKLNDDKLVEYGWLPESELIGL